MELVCAQKAKNMHKFYKYAEIKNAGIKNESCKTLQNLHKYLHKARLN